MASKVDICNLALSKLGTDRIISLTDNTVSAKECNFRYDLIAEFTMSAGSWPSCVKRASLAQLTDTPTYGFDYAYQLPTDPRCLRVLAINELKLGDTDYSIEDGKLLSNETTMDILYIAFITDPGSYDTYLTQAIVENLAADMAFKFTGSIDTAQKMQEYANKKMMELLNMAGCQGSGEVIPSDSYTDIRK